MITGWGSLSGGFCLFFKYGKWFLSVLISPVFLWEDKYPATGECSPSGQHAQSAPFGFLLLHIALPSVTPRNILQNLCAPNPADIGTVGNSEKGVRERKRRKKKKVKNHSMFPTKHHCEFSNHTTSNESIEKWEKKIRKRLLLSPRMVLVFWLKKKKKKNPTPHKWKKLKFLKLLAKWMIYKQSLIKQKKYGILITREQWYLEQLDIYLYRSVKFLLVTCTRYLALPNSYFSVYNYIYAGI